MDLFVHCAVDNFEALECSVKEAVAKGLDVTKILDPQQNTLMHACAQQSSLQCMHVVAKFAPALVSLRHATSQAEPLHLAVAAGNLNAVHCLLRLGANPNSLCPDSVLGQMTPLCGATTKTNIPMVSLLLKAGAKVDTLSLFTAVRCSQVGIVVMLLDHCAAAGTMGVVRAQLPPPVAAAMSLPPGCTPLLAAVSLGLHELAMVLIRAGSNIEQADAKGRRPIHVAASRNDVHMIRLLLQSNVQVNATRESDAWNALHFAAESNAFQATTFLLQLGFQANACANNLATTLHIACWNNSVSVVQALISAKAALDQPMERGWTPLAIAAKNGSETTVVSLLKAGAAVNPKSADSPAPLFHALVPNNDSVVRALLRFKADANKANSKGLTPLFMAASRGYLGMLRLLLEHGARIGQGPGNTKVTPLMQATAFKHPECAQVLLLAKANPSAVSSNNMTPMFLAIKNHNARGLSVLLTFKADPNAELPVPEEQSQVSGASTGTPPKKSGVLTPLTACVAHDFAEGCAVLLKAGANANYQQPESGWTALHSAVSRRLKDCCQALAASTELQCRDRSGRTPLDMARAAGVDDIATVLSTPHEAALALSQLMNRLQARSSQQRTQQPQHQAAAPLGETEIDSKAGKRSMTPSLMPSSTPGAPFGGAGAVPTFQPQAAAQSEGFKITAFAGGRAAGGGGR
eukprot:INCI2249.1.p1 GENE.INCI2249.1~~INCI2249.1.p1  ORF type:complete len:691 (-),score=118.53 INCI2249.1:1305-3377(-)